MRHALAPGRERGRHPRGWEIALVTPRAWGVGPVVFPADDEVALGVVVAVAGEVGGLELELDAAGVPVVGAGLGGAEGEAVGEAGADGDDGVAEVGAEEAEDVDDAGFGGG